MNIPIGFDEVLRRDFMSFTQRSFLELNPDATFFEVFFLEVMASALTDCIEGRCNRLIINLNPRSLKSIMCSVALPAMILGRSPSSNIICASYGQALSEKLARDTLALITSPFYKRLFPGTILSLLAANDFRTSRKGGRMATSVGGPLMGRGADFIIIDDPQKTEDAMSLAGRTASNNWYDHTLISRLNNKLEGVIIIVMQRLHQEDLTGHVLELGPWRTSDRGRR